MRNLFFCFYILSLPFFSWGMELREALSTGSSGDYVVTLQNHMYTLFLIHERTDTTLILEEISVPQERRHTKKLSWQEWIEIGAPFHNSWVMYEVDQETGALLEYYSFTRNGWMDLETTDNFLPQLLNLSFQAVPASERKRIGATRQNTGADRRPYWQPKLFFNGKKIPNVTFEAWKATWPKDGTELADKTIEIYLPATPGEYPAYFPYWLQIGNGLGHAFLRIVDTGNLMQSPKKTIPRRPPVFVSEALNGVGDLILTIKAASYFKGFSLFATQKNNLFSDVIPLDTTLHVNKEGSVTLIVSAQELAEKLTGGQKYFFVAVPKETNEVFVESQSPFLYRP